ncbi:MAG: acyl-CoA dehydrogenase family protein [Parasphingorhabdus sp.]
MSNPEILARHIAIAYGAPELGAAIDVAHDEATVADILHSASRFADDHLVALNHVGDRVGSLLDNGRVKTPAGHQQAWAAFRDGGWLLLDARPEDGGMGLPSSLASATQEMFDSACPAFGMMPVPIRAALRLIKAIGGEAIQKEWIAPLTRGLWSTTICISEPDAGSDVRRIRTRATRHEDGSWRVTGEKCWISFGDQDITDRIGHCLLAKTEVDGDPDAISLFLVPDRFGDSRNNIIVRRVEEKLGLHLSPTCALGFEESTGFLLGEPGRGLQQLFVMIAQMRLATATQGAGIAANAYGVARQYAADRRQGGTGAVAVAIEDHADIQRILLQMAGRIETLRGLVHATANALDLAEISADQHVRDHHAALASWLLPIVKTLGGEIAFGCASDAIQILGGAGYTKEWPVEQCLRDARVLTLFEGTTGMQAQDLLFRRLLGGNGAAFKAFITTARKDAAGCGQLETALDRLEEVALALGAPDVTRRDQEAGATAFLSLASAVACGWIGARLEAEKPTDPIASHLAVAGQSALQEMDISLTYQSNSALRGASSISRFGDLI